MNSKALKRAYGEKNQTKIDVIEGMLKVIDNLALMKWRERFSGEVEQSI